MTLSFWHIVDFLKVYASLALAAEANGGLLWTTAAKHHWLWQTGVEFADNARSNRSACRPIANLALEKQMQDYVIQKVVPPWHQDYKPTFFRKLEYRFRRLFDIKPY